MRDGIEHKPIRICLAHEPFQFGEHRTDLAEFADPSREIAGAFQDDKSPVEYIVAAAVSDPRKPSYGVFGRIVDYERARFASLETLYEKLDPEQGLAGRLAMNAI